MEILYATLLLGKCTRIGQERWQKLKMVAGTIFWGEGAGWQTFSSISNRCFILIGNSGLVHLRKVSHSTMSGDRENHLSATKPPAAMKAHSDIRMAAGKARSIRAYCASTGQLSKLDTQ